MSADPTDTPRDPTDSGLVAADDLASSEGGNSALRLAGRLWPSAALLLLLGVTVRESLVRDLWHIPGPVFIGVLMGAAIGGWILARLAEVARLPVLVSWRPPDLGHGSDARRTVILARAVLGVAVLAGLGTLLWTLLGISSSARHDVLRLGFSAGVLLVAGAAGRFSFGSRDVVHQLIIGAALASWAIYDVAKLPALPFRDLKLYLGAGGTWLDGHAVYLTAPLTRVPSDPSLLPFVYPPFLLPLFGALDRLPLALAIVVWEVTAVAAIVLSLRLLGVRTKWLPVLMLWPPIALGLSVGNAAPFGFLGLAAGWRWGPALVLGGVFKAQAAIPSLWLLRERRWRPFVLGAAVVVGLVLVTLPLTGVAIYGDWVRGLQAFETTIRRYPPMQGFALQRALPEAVAIGLGVGAVITAALASGRMGLSRFGLASIVASPSVYVHGLTFVLPAALWLDTASLWLILGLVPTGSGAWLAIVVAGIALLFGLVRGAGTPRDPAEASPLVDGRASMHLLDPGRVPWP